MLQKITKKCIKLAAIMLVVVVVGGVSGVLFDRIVFPWMSSIESLKNFSILKKANENVTVINKTEQVTVYENFSVAKTSQNILPAVVSIVEYEETESLVGVQNKIKSSDDIKNSVKTGMFLTGDGLIVSVSRESKDLSLVQNSLNQETKKYKVFTSDRRELDAEKISEDEYAGIELYKVDVQNAPVVQLGDSNNLETGEKVIVVGNATGEYQNTFSLGVINEFNRRFTMLNSELASSEKLEGAIISDALIGENNIGGPVVDFNGTVIGIASYVEKDGERVGFIFPINKLKSSFSRAMSKEDESRGSLGVYYLSINKEISLLNNLSVSEGALIYSFTGQQGLAVKKGSAAEIAGLRLGDIVVSVDGEKVTLEKPLSELVSERKKGDEVVLKILRNEKESELPVLLQ